MKTAYFKAMILLLLVFAASAMAQTLYFLPPYDSEWMRRTPNVIDLDNNYANTPMEIDLDGCGWYKINLGALASHRLVIWPGKPKASTFNSDDQTDRMGVKGVDEGPENWTGTPPMPEPIVFNDKSSTPFFNPADGANGWGTGRGSPDYKRCNYNMAAIIYDTDPSVMSAFNCLNTGTRGTDHKSGVPDGCDFDHDPATGIIKNLPKAMLVKNNKGVPKMEWRGRTSGLNGWNQTDFNDAFKCTEGKNAMVCYDMPFQRDHRGLWTFDSDFLCNNGSLDLDLAKTKRISDTTDIGKICKSGNGPALGFFPNRLNNKVGTPDWPQAPGWRENEDPILDASCSYTNCPDCAKKYVADPLAPLHTKESATLKNCGNQWYSPTPPRTYVNPECYEMARKTNTTPTVTGGASANCSVTYGPETCGDAYGEGDFVDGDHPAIWNFEQRGYTYLDGGNYVRPDDRSPNGKKFDPYFKDYFYKLHGNSNGNQDSIRNQYFCFESHATFIYEKGQKFYFSGDDDIWVYINDRIMIDNGGNHLATPGYVDLDSIGSGRWASALAVSGVADGGNYPALVEGDEYPLDIFFCDRRQTASNIRVSTNMYISQKSGIFVDKGDGKNSTAEVCIQKSGSGTCAALLGGDAGTTSTTKLCGSQVNGEIGFYLINRRLDESSKALLDGTNKDNKCNEVAGSGGKKFVCYGGINIDLSEGKAKVNMNEVSDLAGTWYLYAYAVNNPGNLIAPEKVATITTQTFVKMAWGEIREEDVDGAKLTNVVCQQNPIAATGELVPVCFSSGDVSGNYFFTGPVNSVGGITGIGGSTLRPSATLNHLGQKLKVYFDSLGTYPAKIDSTYTLPKSESEAKPNSGSGPGVLVLWVTGDYVQEINPDTYTINVSGRAADEAVTLTSVIPELQWVKERGGDPLNITGADRQNKGSKWTIPGDPTSPLVREDGHPAAVWVGEVINLHLRAYNTRTNKVCTTCNYDLSLTASANDISLTDYRLITASNLRITNGYSDLGIAGKENVLDPSYAKIVVKGVSSLKDAMWDSLQFQEPPVPYPENTKIYDDNGDGVGDRMVIIYNRGFRADSLPNVIRVQWDKDTTVRYGIGDSTVVGKDTVYSAANINKGDNRQYWARYLKGNPNLEARNGWDKGQMMGVNDTIELKRGPNDENDVRFSKNVLTRNETGKILNWVSFKTGEGLNAKLFDIPLTGSIEDKIPAIVVNARYLADEANKGCGGSPSAPCRDKISLEFSEPVKIVSTAADATDEEIKNTFAYMLRDIGRNTWDILEAGAIPSNNSMRYNVSKDMRPDFDGRDSMVSIYFDRFREGDNKSLTPMPGDSVRFAAQWRDINLGKNILIDNHDNPPNPKEIGRQIEGRKPFTPEKLPIGEIDPNYPDYVNNIKETLDRNGSSGYDDDGHLFNNSRPVELLPVPPDCDINCIRREYPGTIGMVFNPDVFNELADLEDLYGPIADGDITIYPTVFYHTNLGNYVADRSFSVKCDDPIFPRNDKNQPSCRDSRSKFYIAWDMKDAKGRYVGAGAYVGIYDFRWEVYISKINKTEKKENIERKVEMHGVKRVKKK